MPITLMKEETISNFILRSLHVSGALQIEFRVRQLFAPHNGEWILFPMSDEEMIKTFSGLFETLSIKSVIRNHTLAPIYKLTASNLDNSIQRYCTIHNMKSSYYEAKKPFDVKEVTTAKTKFCPLCFDKQVSEFGFTWFKREWQLNSMRACLEHECELLSQCGCGESFTKVRQIIALMQGRCDECGSNPWIPRYSEKKSDFARWLRNLLHCDIEELSTPLRRFLHERCEEILGCSYQETLFSGYDSGRLLEPGILAMMPTSTKVLRGYSGRIKSLVGPVPYAIILYPLSLAFPNFMDFKVFLDKISYSSCCLHNADNRMLQLDPFVAIQYQSRYN